MFNRTVRKLYPPQNNQRFFSQALGRFDKVSKNLFSNLSKATREHILNPEQTPPPAVLSAKDKTHLLDYVRINLLSNFRLSAFANFENPYIKQALDVGSHEGASLANLNLAISILVSSFPHTFVVDYLPASPLHLIAYNKYPTSDMLLKKIQPLCSTTLLEHSDFIGNTALHAAALNQNHPLIKWLIAQGANPNFENAKGLCAAQCFSNAVDDAINPHRSEYIDGIQWSWGDKDRPTAPSDKDVEILKLFDDQRAYALTAGHN